MAQSIPSVPTPPPGICHFVLIKLRMPHSLRSKRFRLVSEQRKTEERYSRVLAARTAINETKSQKNEGRGRGKGRKETLADKPLDFENLRSPANAAPDWLG